MGAFERWNTYPQDKRKNQTIIPAPDDPSLWPAWRQHLRNWRASMRTLFNDGESLYGRPEFAWTTSTFASALIPVFDLQFYDQAGGHYQIEKMLDDAEREFGGYDLVVVWCGYPQLGFDDRNSFDLLLDLPGGKEGLASIGETFHRRGVRIMPTYLPWDTGTRPDPRPEAERIAEVVRLLDADGIYLDCMDFGDTGLRQALDAVRPGLVAHTENAVIMDNLAEHHMCWGQWNSDSRVPGVVRNKWLEPRHMQYQLHRWRLDHSEELQVAWLNGSGIVMWENVFGSQIRWNPRDRSFARTMLPIQRRYSALFADPAGWTPLVETLLPDVYGNLWEKDGIRLWTLVNRSEKQVRGTLLCAPANPDEQFFDLVNGRALDLVKGSVIELSGAIGPRGIGCFLAVAAGADPGPNLAGFLEQQADLALRANWEASTEGAIGVPVKIHPTRPIEGKPSLSGMVRIRGGEVTMASYFVVREDRLASVLHGGPGAPQVATEFPALHTNVNFPQLHAVAVERRVVPLRSFALDETPVTNAQFAEFLAATGYRPRHGEHFLALWQDGKPPLEKLDHPVVYVDMDDARAYATWAHKRLPTEEEWQFAAQGNDGRIYPWGNSLIPGTHNDGSTGDTTPVMAFPAGRSPFGVYDMAGNIWEWTDSERSDGRTRSCSLRGGSYYRTHGSQVWAEDAGRWLKARDSDWYAPQGPQRCDFSTSLILMWAGTDRRATIGFRCAADLPADVVSASDHE